MDNDEVRNIPPSMETGGGIDGTKAPASTEELGALPGFRILFTSAEVIGGILVILIITHTIAYGGGFDWSSGNLGKFNWHPLLTTIGMIYLFGNGLLLFRFLRNKRKRSLNITHASILFATFALSLIGIVIAFDVINSPISPKEHLRSLHSWFGIVTFVGFTLQWLIGFVTFLYPGLAAHLRGTVLPFHTFFGLILFIMACVSAATGFGTIKSKSGYEGLLVNQIGLILMLFAAIVVYLAIHLPYKRQPKTEDYNLSTRQSK